MNIVLVNNFNYSRFLGECVRSALGQTAVPDKVIVVDDGSTDDSRSVIEALARANPTVSAVFKQNGGQLSCFNAAAPMVGDDDWVFLLDADDSYPPDYLERMLSRARSGADFLFCSVRRMPDGGSLPDSARLSDRSDEDIPRSGALALRAGIWVGQPTSALAIRGVLYKKMLPYADERSWRTRADDVLVFSSSILNARKRYVPSLAVSFRVHDSNHYFHRPRTLTGDEQDVRRRALGALVQEMTARAGAAAAPTAWETLREYTAVTGRARRDLAWPGPVGLARRIFRTADGSPAF